MVPWIRKCVKKEMKALSREYPYSVVVVGGGGGGIFSSSICYARKKLWNHMG